MDNIVKIISVFKSCDGVNHHRINNLMSDDRWSFITEKLLNSININSLDVLNRKINNNKLLTIMVDDLTSTREKELLYYKKDSVNHVLGNNVQINIRNFIPNILDKMWLYNVIVTSTIEDKMFFILNEILMNYDDIESDIINDVNFWIDNLFKFKKKTVSDYFYKISVGLYKNIINETDIDTIMFDVFILNKNEYIKNKKRIDEVLSILFHENDIKIREY